MTHFLHPASPSTYIRDPWKDKDEEPSQVNVEQLSASLISKLIASRDQPPAPQGISSVSSMERSTAVKAPQFRPVLPLPVASGSKAETDVNSQSQKNQNPLLTIAQIAIRNDGLTDDDASLFAEQIECDMTRMKQVHEELKAARVKYMESEKQEKTWGVLQTVLQYVASASAIVFGVALVASGVGIAAGAFLIAAGGIGLANQIMTDTHAWEALVSYFTKNHELQIKVANRIQTGMILLSIALSLTGGALALQTNAITELPSVEKALKIVALATGILGAGTALTTGSIRNRSCQIKSEITRLEGEATELKHNIKQNVSRMREVQKVHQEMIESVKQSMQNLEIMAK
jgi:hypothetical protein